MVGQDLVLCHWEGEDEGQSPNETHSDQGISPVANARSLFGVHHGDVSVHRHGHKCKNAHQHTNHDKIVSKCAYERSEYPLRQRVNSCVKRDAKNQKGQVRYAEVQDEDVGGAPRALSGLILADDKYNQAVANNAKHKYNSEDNRNYYSLWTSLVLLGVETRPVEAPYVGPNLRPIVRQQHVDPTTTTTTNVPSRAGAALEARLTPGEQRDL